MANYFLEAINSTSRTRFKTSHANRFLIKNVTENATNGTYNFYVQNKGTLQRVPVNLRLQRPPNIIIRDSSGTPFDPMSVVNKFMNDKKG